MTEAAGVAKELGARAAWKFLEKRLGEEELDLLQFNWRRYKREVQKQEKPHIPKVESAKEESPLASSFTEVQAEEPSSFDLILQHPRSREPLEPITLGEAFSSEERALQQALAEQPKTLGELVVAFAKALGLTGVDTPLEVSQLYDEVLRLLGWAEEVRKKRVSKRVAALAQKAKRQPNLILLCKQELRRLAQEETDEALLSDIERTLQELEEMLGEQPAESEEVKGVPASPTEVPTDFPLHPIFLGDAAQIYHMLLGNEAPVDLETFIDIARDDGWSRLEAEVVWYLTNFSPSSFSELLQLIATSEPAMDRNVLAEEVAAALNSLGNYLLEEGLASVAPSPTLNPQFLEDLHAYMEQMEQEANAQDMSVSELLETYGWTFPMLRVARYLLGQPLEGVELSKIAEDLDMEEGLVVLTLWNLASDIGTTEEPFEATEETAQTVLEWLHASQEAF